MSKVKVPRKSTAIDMTAMCDVAFLLLTFFMLTTKFKPDEPVVVDTPSSVSEIKLPETDILQITVDKENKIFFNVDGKQTREGLLKKLGVRYNVAFTPKEYETFSALSSLGIPAKSLKSYLDKTPDQRKEFKQPGIPCDTTSTNELGDWIWFARLSASENKHQLRVALKGDRDAKYPVVKQIISTLQEKKVNKFNFITNLENNPEK